MVLIESSVATPAVLALSERINSLADSTKSVAAPVMLPVNVMVPDVEVMISAVLERTTFPNNDMSRSAVTSSLRSIVATAPPNAVSLILPAVEVNVLSISIAAARLRIARILRSPTVVAGPKTSVVKLEITFKLARGVTFPTVPKATSPLLTAAALITRLKAPFKVSPATSARKTSSLVVVIVTSSPRIIVCPWVRSTKSLLVILPSNVTLPSAPPPAVSTTNPLTGLVEPMVPS